MKARGFVLILFLVAFTFPPAWMSGMPAPPPAISATLMSPKAGEVLYPGERVRVEWKTSIPNPIQLESWEMELWLSLDGGRTYTMRITPSMDPKTTFFYWIVPNTPTNSALIDIRFGCEPFYPETYHAQTASPFVIANGGAGQY
jgi:hypothetical protein